MTLLWLRQRLMRNQWLRGGTINAVISMIVAICGIVAGMIGGIAGVAAGFFAVSESSPIDILVIWDVIIVAFLFFWMIGIVNEIQRSETIDIHRILHLPISIKDIFLLNFLASHLTPSIIFFLPGMLGFCLGLAASRGWAMLLQIGLVLSFIFMITSWTYCLRGWLVALMVNKRRRRTIIVGITFTFILICQVPNIIGNVVRYKSRNRPETVKSEDSDPDEEMKAVIDDVVGYKDIFVSAHHYVPILWVGNGARYLSTGNCWPGILGTLGAGMIGLLGLRRGYRTTQRFYQGQTGGKTGKVKRKIKTAGSVKKDLWELKLPGLPTEACSMGGAFLRMLIRAPEVKMALGMNFLMLVIFGGLALLNRSGNIDDNIKPFVCTGALSLNFLGMVQLMFNQFGFDRSGFRAMVLLPVDRRYILLGKNIAFGMIGFVIGFILLVLVNVIVGFSIMMFIATCFQLVTAILMMSILGNLFSVLVPFRVSAGSLKPTKASAKTSFMMLICHMFYPMGMIPVFVSPVFGLLMSKLGWIDTAKATLWFSVVMLGIALALYKLALGGLGSLLQQREKKIIEIVTHEVE